MSPLRSWKGRFFRSIMERNVFICLVIFFVIVGVVTFIFGNSLESREMSTDKSEGLLKYVISIMKIEDNPVMVGKVHKTLRKTAHVFEFALLGVFSSLFFRKIEKIKERKYICCPFLIGLCVAVADEFIQSFNDRSSEVLDIIIDFGGVIAGVVITMIIFVIADKKRKLKEKELCEKQCGSV